MPTAILNHKYYQHPSVFVPENLLREARRQKGIDQCPVPSVCILDPDGDLATYLTEKGLAQKSKCWACYHSSLFQFEIENTIVGIIPGIVGSAYAVLVAEQLFVSGCELLISVTSAGIINPPTAGKKFALITEAIRDEGTSYHYLRPEDTACIGLTMLNKLSAIAEVPWFNAKSWTTDAPYRETQAAIDAMKKKNVVCVEMEAAALYAFATAKSKNIICFAHLTNTMAQNEGDFEKGEYFGSIDTLELLNKIIYSFS